MQQYNVNITGGSEKVKYFVGANILMQVVYLNMAIIMKIIVQM